MSNRNRRVQGQIEVLPPEPRSEGMRVRLDAAHLQKVSLHARSSLAESELPRILDILVKQARLGCLETVVNSDNYENWRAQILFEALQEPLQRLGFTVMIATQERRIHYSVETVPALAVSWRTAPSL